METINYKNLEWYVINETDKEKLLFLKDCFTKEQTLKYFKTLSDPIGEIRFSIDEKNPWWRDSLIRSELNNEFLNNLDINDLNEMETTVELNGEKVTTKDYVRLITKEEVELLDVVILCTSKKLGYWTMSPADFRRNYEACEVSVRDYGNIKYLDWLYVNHYRSVRPIISLKKKTLDRGLILSDEEEMIRELKRAVLL